METKRNSKEFQIILVVLFSTIVFYAPFLYSGEMDYIYRYWDGPNYAYIAQTLYDIPKDHPLQKYTTPSYFAAHLPLYPLAIRVFSFVGYLESMLLVTFIFTVLGAISFYKLLEETQVVENPFWSCILSLFIPARYLIYNNVGATEPVFIYFLIQSLLFYCRGRYALAFAFAGLSSITRITGILLVVSYFATIIHEKKANLLKYLPIIGLPLTCLFLYYAYHYGTFFAYLDVNYSDEKAKIFYLHPFLIFKTVSQIGEVLATENYLNIYTIYGIGVAMLWKKSKPMFWMAFVHYVFFLFVFHHDISRYFLVIAPLALIVAYDFIFSKGFFKILFIPLLMATYFQAWKLIPHNMVDIQSYLHLKSKLETPKDKGLKASYFYDEKMQNLIFTTVEEDINHNWGYKLLHEVPNTDTFYAKWEGEIEASESGVYTFQTTSDDGIKVYIDNKKIIDNWFPHGSLTAEASISIEKKKKIPIKVEYFDAGGHGEVQVLVMPPGKKSFSPLSRLNIHPLSSN